MIRALVKRGGVIGINFYDKFLLAPDGRSVAVCAQEGGLVLTAVAVLHNAGQQ